MARNAHPEQTRERILDAAEQLFATKGYAHTSIQDIVNALGDLSKGAIYHHFASKHEILRALGNRDSNAQMTWFTALQQRSDLNGLQKIQESLRHEAADTEHIRRIRMALPTLSDPESFTLNLRNWAQTLPETLYLPLIEEGIDDGSITTEYPREAAQLLSLLPNLWFLPPLFGGTRAEIRHRLECLGIMLESIGLPVFTVKLVDTMADFYAALAESKETARPAEAEEAEESAQ